MKRLHMETVRKGLALYLALAMALTQALPYGFAGSDPVENQLKKDALSLPTNNYDETKPADAPKPEQVLLDPTAAFLTSDNPLSKPAAEDASKEEVASADVEVPSLDGQNSDVDSSRTAGESGSENETQETQSWITVTKEEAAEAQKNLGALPVYKYDIILPDSNDHHMTVTTVYSDADHNALGQKITETFGDGINGSTTQVTWVSEKSSVDEKKDESSLQVSAEGIVSWFFTNEDGEKVYVEADQSFLDSNFQIGHLSITISNDQGVAKEQLELDIVDGNPLVAEVLRFAGDGVTVVEDMILNFSNAKFNDRHEITGGVVSFMMQHADGSSTVGEMNFSDSRPSMITVTEYSAEGEPTAYKSVDLSNANFGAGEGIDIGEVSETTWTDENRTQKVSKTVLTYKYGKAVKSVTTQYVYQADGSVTETTNPTDPSASEWVPFLKTFKCHFSWRSPLEVDPAVREQLIGAVRGYIGDYVLDPNNQVRFIHVFKENDYYIVRFNYDDGKIKKENLEIKVGQGMTWEPWLGGPMNPLVILDGDQTPTIKFLKSLQEPPQFYRVKGVPESDDTVLLYVRKVDTNGDGVVDGKDQPSQMVSVSGRIVLNYGQVNGQWQLVSAKADHYEMKFNFNPDNTIASIEITHPERGVALIEFGPLANDGLTTDAVALVNGVEKKFRASYLLWMMTGNISGRGFYLEDPQASHADNRVFLVPPIVENYIDGIMNRVFEGTRFELPEVYGQASELLNKLMAQDFVTLQNAEDMSALQAKLKSAIEALPERFRAEWVRKFNNYLTQSDRILSSKSLKVVLQDGREVIVRNSPDVMAQIIRRFKMLDQNGEVELDRLAGIDAADLKGLETVKEYFDGRQIGTSFDLPSFDLFSPRGNFKLIDRLVRKYPVTLTEGPLEVLNVDVFLSYVDGTQQAYGQMLEEFSRIFSQYPVPVPAGPWTLEKIKTCLDQFSALNQALSAAVEKVLNDYQGEPVFKDILKSRILQMVNNGIWTSSGFAEGYTQKWSRFSYALWDRHDNFQFTINGTVVTVTWNEIEGFVNLLPNDSLNLFRYPGIQANVDPAFLKGVVTSQEFWNLASIQIPPATSGESDPVYFSFPGKLQVFEVLLKTWASQVVRPDGTVNFDKLRFRMLISYDLEIALGRAEEYLANQNRKMLDFSNRKFQLENCAAIYDEMKALLAETQKELQARFNPLLKDVIYDTFNEVTSRVAQRYQVLVDSFNQVLGNVVILIPVPQGTITFKPADINRDVLEKVLNAISIRMNGYMGFSRMVYQRMNGITPEMLKDLLSPNQLGALTSFSFNTWGSSQDNYLATQEVLFKLIPKIVQEFGMADVDSLTRKLTENLPFPVELGQSLEATVRNIISDYCRRTGASIDTINIQTIDDLLKLRDVMKNGSVEFKKALSAYITHLLPEEVSQIEGWANYWWYWNGNYTDNWNYIVQKFNQKVASVEWLTVRGVRVPVRQILNIENFPWSSVYNRELFVGLQASDFSNAEVIGQASAYSYISLSSNISPYPLTADLSGLGRIQLVVNIMDRLMSMEAPPAIIFDHNGTKEVDPEAFRKYIKGVTAMQQAVYAEARTRTAALVAEFKKLEKGAYTIEEINALHDKLLVLRQGLIEFLDGKAQVHERRDVIETEDEVSLIYQDAFDAFVRMVGRANLVVNVRGASVVVPAKEITAALVDYIKANINKNPAAHDFARLFGIDVDMVRQAHKLENFLGEQMVVLPRNSEYVQIVSQLSELGYMQLASALVKKYADEVVVNGKVNVAKLIDLVTNKNSAVAYAKKSADAFVAGKAAEIQALNGRPITLEDFATLAKILGDIRVGLVSMMNDFLSGNADDGLQQELEDYITGLYEKTRDLWTNKTFEYEINGQKIQIQLTKELIGRFTETIRQYLLSNPQPVYDPQPDDPIYYDLEKRVYREPIYNTDFLALDTVQYATALDTYLPSPVTSIWMPVRQPGDYNPAYHPTELAMAELFFRLAVKYGDFAAKADANGVLKFDMDRFLKELLLTDADRADRRLDQILAKDLPALQQYLGALKDSNGAIPVSSLQAINDRFMDVKSKILKYSPDDSAKAGKVWENFMSLYEDTLFGEKTLLSFEMNGQKITFEAAVLDRLLMELYQANKLDPELMKKFSDLIQKGETTWQYNNFKWLQSWINYDNVRDNSYFSQDLAVKPGAGAPVYSVDEIINFGGLAVIPGINRNDLSDLEAAEMAGRLILTPLDPLKLMGMLDMRTLAPGSGVSAGGMMKAQSASMVLGSALMEQVSLDYKIIGKPILIDLDPIGIWEQPIGDDYWVLGTKSQRFRVTELIPAIIEAFVNEFGMDELVRDGKLIAGNFSLGLENKLRPIVLAKKAALADLANVLGVSPAQLKELIESIEVDPKTLGVTIKLRDGQMAGLIGVLDEDKAPSIVVYEVQAVPSSIDCVDCAKESYQIVSARMGWGIQSFDGLVTGLEARIAYDQGRIQSVVWYGPDPECQVHECYWAGHVALYQDSYVYGEGVIEITRGSGQNLVMTLEKLGDGQYHIKKLKEYDEAVTKFEYDVRKREPVYYPDCDLSTPGCTYDPRPDCIVAGPGCKFWHDPFPKLGATLISITRVDGNGNPLSKTLINGTTVIVDVGDEENHKFEFKTPLESLLDEIRKIEREHEVMKQLRQAVIDDLAGTFGMKLDLLKQWLAEGLVKIFNDVVTRYIRVTFDSKLQGLSFSDSIVEPLGEFITSAEIRYTYAGPGSVKEMTLDNGTPGDPETGDKPGDISILTSDLKEPYYRLTSAEVFYDRQVLAHEYNGKVLGIGYMKIEYSRNGFSAYPHTDVTHIWMYDSNPDVRCGDSKCVTHLIKEVVDSFWNPCGTFMCLASMASHNAVITYPLSSDVTKRVVGYNVWQRDKGPTGSILRVAEYGKDAAGNDVLLVADDFVYESKTVTLPPNCNDSGACTDHYLTPEELAAFYKEHTYMLLTQIVRKDKDGNLLSTIHFDYQEMNHQFLMSRGARIVLANGMEKAVAYDSLEQLFDLAGQYEKENKGVVYWAPFGDGKVVIDEIGVPEPFVQYYEKAYQIRFLNSKGEKIPYADTRFSNVPLWKFYADPENSHLVRAFTMIGECVEINLDKQTYKVGGAHYWENNQQVLQFNIYEVSSDHKYMIPVLETWRIYHGGVVWTETSNFLQTVTRSYDAGGKLIREVTVAERGENRLTVDRLLDPMTGAETSVRVEWQANKVPVNIIYDALLNVKMVEDSVQILKEMSGGTADGRKISIFIREDQIEIYEQLYEAVFGGAMLVIEKTWDAGGKEILTAKIQVPNRCGEGEKCGGYQTLESFDVASYDDSQKDKLLITTNTGEKITFNLSAGTYVKDESVSSVGKYPVLAKETVAKLFTNSTGSFFRTLSQTLTAPDKSTPVQRIIRVYKNDGTLEFERLISDYDQHLVATTFRGFTTVYRGKKAAIGKAGDFEMSEEDSSGLLQSIKKTGILIADIFKQIYW